MNSNDLMLGDFVHSYRHEVDTQITDLEHDAVWLKDHSCWERHFMSEIRPIPLTAEILKDNGWVGDRKLKLTTDQCVLTASEISDSVWKLDYDSNEFSSIHFSVHVCYVHELQHALRFYGITREIII